MRVHIHKIGSSTAGLLNDHEVSLLAQASVRPGDVVVAKALEEKRVYDQLELVSGRLAHISKGDVIAGSVGTRRALRGFVGDCPKHVRTGDVLHVLNMGGVIGVATSVNADYGHPLRVKVLGLVASGPNVLNIDARAIACAQVLDKAPPLIVVAGTCMAAGKTRAACEIIGQLNQRGFRLGALKLSGVAALRDPLNMQDHGAQLALSFLDAGFNSTATFTDLAPMAKGLIRAMAERVPDLDAIVVELGDGIIGDYGVGSIYRDSQLREAIAFHVLCANDLVAAWGAHELAKTLGREIDVFSGPATDNTVGARYIEDQLGVPAVNARTHGERLADLVAFGVFRREAKT